MFYRYSDPSGIFDFSVRPLFTVGITVCMCVFSLLYVIPVVVSHKAAGADIKEVSAFKSPRKDRC